MVDYLYSGVTGNGKLGDARVQVVGDVVQIGVPAGHAAAGLDNSSHLTKMLGWTLLSNHLLGYRSRRCGRSPAPARAVPRPRPARRRPTAAVATAVGRGAACWASLALTAHCFALPAAD